MTGVVKATGKVRAPGPRPIEARTRNDTNNPIPSISSKGDTSTGFSDKIRQQ